MELLREKFLKTYANIPLNIRDEIIIVLDGKGPITWNVAYLEIKQNSESSELILTSLNELQLI
jgi:hypothetical protein